MLQGIFYSLALVGWLGRDGAGRNTVFYVPFYLCAMNLAALLGLWRFLTGYPDHPVAQGGTLMPGSRHCCVARRSGLMCCLAGCPFAQHAVLDRLLADMEDLPVFHRPPAPPACLLLLRRSLRALWRHEPTRRAPTSGCGRWLEKYPRSPTNTRTVSATARSTPTSIRSRNTTPS